MKKIIFFFSILLFFGCKEEELKPTINFESAFVINDDPNNPVNHKRYLLYKDYGVSIYFTDTVNTVFLSKNVHGDSVFNYELLDLNWSFTAVGSVNYTFKFLKSDEERLKALDNIDKYLQLTQPNMRPLSILLVDEFTATGNSNVLTVEDVDAPSPRNKITSLNTYRTMVLSQTQKTFSQNFWSKFSLALLKNQVQKNITADVYKSKLLEFQTVSDVTTVDKYYANLPVDLTGFTPASWRTFDYNTQYTGTLATTYDKIISVFGQFGYIGLASFNVWYSPSYVNDRNHYIDAVFTHNQQTFERVWGNYPLVVEKYSIMRDIIENDMNIPLNEIVK